MWNGNNPRSKPGFTALPIYKGPNVKLITEGDLPEMFSTLLENHNLVASADDENEKVLEALRELSLGVNGSATVTVRSGTEIESIVRTVEEHYRDQGYRVSSRFDVLGEYEAQVKPPSYYVTKASLTRSASLAGPSASTFRPTSTPVESSQKTMSARGGSAAVFVRSAQRSQLSPTGLSPVYWGDELKIIVAIGARRDAEREGGLAWYSDHPMLDGRITLLPGVYRPFPAWHAVAEG